MGKSRGPHDSSVRVNGPAVREIRKRTGISGADLATGVGISQAYLRKIESGRSEYIGPALFGRLNRVLRIEDRRALMAAPPSEAFLHPTTVDELNSDLNDELGDELSEEFSESA